MKLTFFEAGSNRYLKHLGGNVAPPDNPSIYNPGNVLGFEYAEGETSFYKITQRVADGEDLLLYVLRVPKPEGLKEAPDGNS